MTLRFALGAYVFAFASLMTTVSFAATDADADTQVSEGQEGSKGKVRYKSGQDVNFEKLLIQGQLRKPSVIVVTGNVQQGGDGLLRIRKEFMDRVAADFGEEAP